MNSDYAIEQYKIANQHSELVSKKESFLLYSLGRI